jgi:DNA repair protein RecN (Recombination protein N)
MLKSLTIQQYALIDALAAEFTSGLTILTGETGAGKSIIVDALGLIIGARTSAEVVRSGEEKAVVEGIFAVAGNRKLAQVLEANDIEPGNELIVRREISARGQSRCFMNDSPVTLNLLKQVGELLVDLHGQHEHQSLLRPETHGEMLDNFGGLDGMVAEFQEAYKHLRMLGEELQHLREREQQLREKRDFYAFQVQEIDAIGPRAGEEEDLTTELNILENAEKLFGTTSTLYELLYEGERSVRDLLVIARNQLQDLATIDKSFAEAGRECASADAIVAELARFIQSYNARVEFNPERLEELRDRLGRLSLLKKKYGGSLEAALAHREHLGRELELVENFEDVTATLADDLESTRQRCGMLAQRLSAKRNEVARRVDKVVVQELKKLGIENGKFTTRIGQEEHGHENGAGVAAALFIRAGNKAIALNGRGYDAVEFFLSTNLGEEEKPLAKVASGGEVSRIMLALKSVLAKSDRLPVLIFDEIDVGVSGRIAQAVGLSLKSLSTFHQVIAITHLPQIAGLADLHFAVVKSETKGRTATTMRKLTLDEQVREVAKLMSGAEITAAGLAGARELMGLR